MTSTHSGSPERRRHVLARVRVAGRSGLVAIAYWCVWTPLAIGLRVVVRTRFQSALEPEANSYWVQRR
jgi:hypothetical protein